MTLRVILTICTKRVRNYARKATNNCKLRQMLVMHLNANLPTKLIASSRAFDSRTTSSIISKQ